MPSAIVSDTSCLIVLNNIGELALLQKLFGNVSTTPEVQAEFGEPLPAWIGVRSPRNGIFQKSLESLADKGEASAIALATELAGSLLIIDDLKGRRVAQNHGLQTTGTLGIIVQAKNKGIIASVKPVLEKIKATDFRLTSLLENEILNQAGEAYQR